MSDGVGPGPRNGGPNRVRRAVGRSRRVVPPPAERVRVPADSPRPTRSFGSASDQATIAAERSSLGDRGQGVSLSFARRKKVKALSCSCMLNPRIAATSNGSPMSGRPFRLICHQMASAAVARPEPIARIDTTRVSCAASCVAVGPASATSDSPLLARPQESHPRSAWDGRPKVVPSGKRDLLPILPASGTVSTTIVI